MTTIFICHMKIHFPDHVGDWGPCCTGHPTLAEAVACERQMTALVAEGVLRSDVEGSLMGDHLLRIAAELRRRGGRAEFRVVRRTETVVERAAMDGPQSTSGMKG